MKNKLIAFVLVMVALVGCAASAISPANAGGGSTPHSEGTEISTTSTVSSATEYDTVTLIGKTDKSNVYIIHTVGFYCLLVEPLFGDAGGQKVMKCELS